MADSLYLVGVRDVRKHAGTEMQLVIPRRGGHTHQVREWWRPKGVNTTYATCTIFRVTTADGSVRLALPTGKFEGSEIRIDHDGDFNFTFSGINELDRAALYTDNMEIIEHYIFPSISGGRIATVTPPGAADRPTAAPPPPPAPTIGTVTLTGEQAPTDGATETYVVSITGNANPTYVLTSSDANDTVSGLDVTYSGAGARTLTVTATDAAASDNGAQGTLAINASVLFATLVANADYSYVVTVANGVYEIDGVAQQAIAANAGEAIYFDLSDASLSTHPFKIYTDATKTTEVTVGVESDANGLIFTPPIAGSFSYQCASHAGMGGTITVSQQQVDGGLYYLLLLDPLSHLLFDQSYTQRYKANGVYYVRESRYKKALWERHT